MMMKRGKDYSGLFCYNGPMNIIARIYNDFPEKFGIPRQPGLVKGLEGRIVFEPEYRAAEAFRGLDGYSHIWLIWDFSENRADGWSPTVRPPHLGGNKRVGVWATRSPFRPNPIGLSLVELKKIELNSPDGPVLHVAGADLMNETPILDIKPYLPYVESIPDARGGFTDSDDSPELKVEIPDHLAKLVPEGKTGPLRGVLAQDPRPHYHDDPERIYGMSFAGMEIRFRVDGGILCVIDIQQQSERK